MIGILVTGTDTDIGKTTISTAILEHFTAEGRRCAALKPAESGWQNKHTDAQRLRVAAGSWQRLDEICRYRYRASIAPAVAAEQEGNPLSFAVIQAQVTAAQEAGAEILVVEGAGGLLVPMVGNQTFADLAKTLGFHAVVVAGAHLGTINHTLLTVEAMRNRGIMVAGVIVNAVRRTPPALIESNVEQIARWTDVPILGVVPYSPDPTQQARAQIQFQQLFEQCST